MGGGLGQRSVPEGWGGLRGAWGGGSGKWMTIMVTLAVLPLPPLMLIGGRFWWLWLTMSVSFAGLFGWLMPLAAER